MPQNDTISPQAVVRQWLESAMNKGEKDTYHSKRRRTRYAWNQPMELMINDKIHYVKSRDIGEGGIGLACRQRLQEGDEVYIRRDERDPWVHGRVTHATETIGAFKTGFELKFEF
jgi:hypothetical protein